jgi:phosphoglycolate phosphatase
MNATANRIRAVILDLDGTLMDTAGEIEAALGRTFAELGIPTLGPDEVRRLIGRGVRSLVGRALEGREASRIDLDDAIERFERHYAALVGTEADLYPGALEGVRRLHAARRRLAVVTNKPRAFTMALLTRVGVDSLIPVVVAGTTASRASRRATCCRPPARKMGPPSGETLMLGDSDNDVMAARAAGCPVWCVPTDTTRAVPPRASRAIVSWRPWKRRAAAARIGGE